MTNTTNTQRRNYLSRKEDDQIVWAHNYVTQLPNYAERLGVSTDQVRAVTKAYEVMMHTREYHLAAADLAKSRTVSKDLAAWSPKAFAILPGVVKTGPAAEEHSPGGFFPLVLKLNDALFAGERLTDNAKVALQLNPLSKRRPNHKPCYTVEIRRNLLTVHFTKEDFVFFRAMIDHGTGQFDTTYHAHKSPLVDPHPLPEDAPQIWRVQLFGYRKDTPPTNNGIPGDIIDVAAKAYTAEHAEGAG